MNEQVIRENLFELGKKRGLRKYVGKASSKLPFRNVEIQHWK